MKTSRIVIVGGGPAGSTCAWKLRQAGLDVLILDKQRFPRDKTCAGWITPAVIEELRIDTREYAAARTLQPITGFRTGLIGGPVVETRYDHPVSFGILRREFDHYLLERCGAALSLGQPLTHLERSADGWLVNHTVHASLVVGAGGHFCPVARQLRGGAGQERVVAAQEMEFELSESQMANCRVDPRMPELYFYSDLAGYAWCFRKGRFLNIGVGREDRAGLPKHAADFLAWMKAEGRAPPDTPERWQGHAYILYGHALRPLLDDHALLIGDAAGLAYPQSGEGIRPAVESALIAAEVIVAASGDYRRDRLQPYAQRMIRRFGRRAPARDATEWLPAQLKRTLAERFLSTRWLTREVLLHRWFLHAHQPAL